jgi:hypothetical protein
VLRCLCRAQWRLFLSRARLLDSVLKLAQRAVQFVEAFRSNGIDLVVYIDGLALPMKRTAMLARRQRYSISPWWDSSSGVPFLF